MNETELQTLIDSLLEGEISEADFLRLEAEMLVRPEARRAYYDKLTMDTLLRGESEQAAQATPLAPPGGGRDWHRIGLSAAAAVALLAAALSGWFIGKKPVAGVTQAAPEEPVAIGFGVLADSSGAMWDGGTPPINRGDLLPTGIIQLASGILKLDLFSGVNVVIEGAAEFELISPMEMRVTRGKIRAQVPEQAHGFLIRSPSGDLVDLGTEFSMEITPEHADLHVLDGEIEWHPKSAEMRQVKQGEALRWARDGQASQIEIEQQTIADVEDTFEQDRQARRAAWLAHSAQHQNDPRLVAYFPMTQPGSWKRRLADASGRDHNARIVAAQQVADRWNVASSALDFSPTGSRARLVIPEEIGSLTFFCWARIDSLDRQFNSLFLTDGHEIGEPHWQIMSDGRLFFSVKKRQWESKERTDKHIYYSPPIWNTSMSGRWMQIATTYDIENRQVTHYIDGRQVSQEAIPEDYLVPEVRIGAASIGNWSEPNRSDPSFAVRNLNGAIDEFAIYSGALSAAEIAQLYEIGKP